MLTDKREGEIEPLGEKPAQLSTFTEENSYDLGPGSGREKQTVIYEGRTESHEQQFFVK